ncbi:MAG: hypothetical protein OWU84_08830 [Firmicutes bacterium]|nr:hypothetical protein [Bacillota bacterium]
MPRGPKQPCAIDPRRLPSGWWKGRVVLYNAETGKRRELTPTFDTKREAKNGAKKEAAAYQDDPNRRPPSEETFDAFFERWLEGVAAARTRDTTVQAYRRYARPLLQALGPKPLKSLTPADFQAVYTQMLKAGH